MFDEDSCDFDIACAGGAVKWRETIFILCTDREVLVEQQREVKVTGIITVRVTTVVTVITVVTISMTLIINDTHQ